MALCLAIGFAGLMPRGTLAQQPLFLMFPYDYLGLAETERRHYVLGVLDARLFALTGKAQYQTLSRCLIEKGLDAFLPYIRKELIPRDNFAVVPMPIVVEQAARELCGLE